MRSTPSRTLAALYQRGEELAYERGQEFDPSLWLSPALCDQLAAAGRACRPVAAPSAYERRRRRARQRREAYGAGLVLARGPGRAGLERRSADPRRAGLTESRATRGCRGRTRTAASRGGPSSPASTP
jgi:hypothetical protein